MQNMPEIIVEHYGNVPTRPCCDVLISSRLCYYENYKADPNINREYGPGASFYTWLEYFPYIDLYFIEYDAACAKKWAANTTGATIFSGDQADIAFLNSFIEQAGTNFDIIIDDGGHHMNQQITSLEVLWKAVIPGG